MQKNIGGYLGGADEICKVIVAIYAMGREQSRKGWV